MATQQPKPTPAPFPHIHLLCHAEEDLSAFQLAEQAHPIPSSFTLSFHTGALQFLEPSIKFDTVVSPANSFGRMDGGFDDALSRALAPKDDYLALTHAVQAKLYEDWKGFAPPGTCTLVPIDFDHATTRNVWGCRRVAVVPTMKVPRPIPWEKEVVFEGMWSLLCAIERWNKDCKEEERIGSVLMTPLGTGTGGLSARKWASQVLIALRQFDEACRDGKKWGSLGVSQILDIAAEVDATHDL